MPIQPTYPGVYIQEVSSGVRTITGVATSIAAFVGRTAKGPINKAVNCPDFSTFLRKFGGAHLKNDLAHSVRQFYDNGGSECYVVRLANGARQADLTLKNFAGADVLRVIAKDAGIWGNNLRIEIDYNTLNPDETFNLRVILEENGAITAREEHINLSMDPNAPRFVVKFVTQSSNLIEIKLAETLGVPFDLESAAQVGYSESRRPLIANTLAAFRTALNDLIFSPPAGVQSASQFEISVNGGGFVPINMLKDPAPLSAANAGSFAALITTLNDKINTTNQLPTGVNIAFEENLITGTTFRLLRIKSNIGNNHSVKIRSATTNDFAAPLMFGVEQGGVEVVRYANHRPVPTATYFSGDLNALTILPQDAFNELTVVGTTTAVDLDPPPLGTNILITTPPANPGDPMPLWFSAKSSPANANNDGVREKLRLLANAVNNTPNLPVKAEVWGYHLAFVPKNGSFNAAFDIATGNTGGGGTNIGLGAAPNLFTKNTRQYALGNGGTSGFQVSPGTIGLDDDPVNPLGVADYTGNELLHTGFYALDKVDIFNLMILPGDLDIDESEYEQISAAASIYCKNRRAFLLTDAPNDWSKNGNLNQDEVKYDEIRAGVIKDYSAIFYPRVQFSDAGIKRYIGASGIIAGLMARTDSQRGVWKAPAGTEADLRGVLDVEVNLTDNENGILNKQGVNCIRKFPNGIVNWGARTLDGADDFGSEWKYIPIRRLALFLEESLFRGTKWVVFEPNDEPLWAKIRLNITAFMISLFRQGAFQGSTPDKAFFVKCDAETTTQNDRNLGIVNIQVGFAPLKPAEFVIITIQQMAGDLV